MLHLLVVTLLLCGPSFGRNNVLADGAARDTNRIEILTPEQAKALVTEFKGDGLCLIGLATLDTATAEAIAESAEHISVQVEDQVRDEFFNRHILNPKTARAWAALTGGRLPMITALDSPDSVAVATALATRKGPLSLPSLRKI